MVQAALVSTISFAVPRDAGPAPSTSRVITMESMTLAA
ncbi:hypothetical protein KCH_00230 [Kitasatospora cheerisanensis KCTC 2395]|uniref:Uncharacterized protein n=1 Tax=Kitasatospora cheerisanensis KCTC 2395 TaxID=1348663 RepID=A0A066Z356_9ACTN|nr:hypothetical protein KCH_00230 [Kitasatospora cheerisanensis KCTC 2395]